MIFWQRYEVQCTFPVNTKLVQLNAEKTKAWAFLRMTTYNSALSLHFS